MRKIYLAIIAVLVILCAALFSRNSIAPTDQPAMPLPPSAQPVAFSWIFTEQREGEQAIPRTAVALAADGQRHELGTHVGTCFAVEGSSWEPLPGAWSGAICWWAGGGREFAVFEEAGRLVVKSGPIEEGTAEIPGIRGATTTVLEISS